MYPVTWNREITRHGDMVVYLRALPHKDRETSVTSQTGSCHSLPSKGIFQGAIFIEYVKKMEVLPFVQRLESLDGQIEFQFVPSGPFFFTSLPRLDPRNLCIFLL
jgi:hypothetical protein